MAELFPDLGKQSDVGPQEPGINSPAEAPGLQIQLFKAQKCHFYHRGCPGCVFGVSSAPCSGRLRGLAARWRDHRAPGQPVVTAPGRRDNLDLSRSLLLFLSTQVPGEAEETLRGPAQRLQKASHPCYIYLRIGSGAQKIWGPLFTPPEPYPHPAV